MSNNRNVRKENAQKKQTNKQTNKKNQFNKLYSWSLQGEASDLREQTICGD